MKKIGLISGSLREGSYNSKIIDEIKNLLPEEYEGHILEIGDLPYYNEDIDGDTPPKEYDKFRQELSEMDAFIFATPEYNRAVPAALKNAIDVGSRPYGESHWDGKPVGVISSSISGPGGMLANHNLRQTFVFLNMHPMQQPEAYLGNIAAEFADGKISERLELFLQNYVEEFVNFASKFD